MILSRNLSYLVWNVSSRIVILSIPSFQLNIYCFCKGVDAVEELVLLGTDCELEVP
jgi:hypothetical protein